MKSDCRSRVGRDERGDEDAERRRRRPPRRWCGRCASLARSPGLLRHRAGERAVGDVDEAVGQAERRVGEVGVEQHAALADLRHREGGDAEQQQRQRAEQDERPELAEALAVGAVDDAAGEHVGEGVEDAHDEQQRAGRGGRDARDIRVVDEQEHRGGGEGEVVRGVAGAVADDAELGCSFFVRCRRCGVAGGGAVVVMIWAPLPRGAVGVAAVSLASRSAVQRARSACAAALGLRSRVNTPFLLPSTRTMPVARSGSRRSSRPARRPSPRRGRARGGTCRGSAVWYSSVHGVS